MPKGWDAENANAEDGASETRTDKQEGIGSGVWKGSAEKKSHDAIDESVSHNKDQTDNGVEQKDTEIEPDQGNILEDGFVDDDDGASLSSSDNNDCSINDDGFNEVGHLPESVDAGERGWTRVKSTMKILPSGRSTSQSPTFALLAEEVVALLQRRRLLTSQILDDPDPNKMRARLKHRSVVISRIVQKRCESGTLLEANEQGDSGPFTTKLRGSDCHPISNAIKLKKIPQ